MNSDKPSIRQETALGAPRTSTLTVAGIALVAYAACDMVHEVLGHGLACALTGARALTLSSVALQTASDSRFIAAAGSVANLIAGVLGVLLFRCGSSFGPARYFLWLFASTNLLNGTGYLFFSGVLNYGDWSVVIAGLQPHSTWRVVMAALGAVLYVGSVQVIAASLISLVRSGEVDRREVRRLVFPAYLAGGLLFVAAAALNRVSPSLILASGLSSGFGAMAGLAMVPRIVQNRTLESVSLAAPLRRSVSWMVAGGVVALVFIAVLGPGVRLP